MAKTRDFAEVIRRQLASDPKLAAEVEAERSRMNISEQVFACREELHLTQAEFAERVGMHQSAIARLEDARYTGHSIQTLEKIAAAIGKRLEVRLVENSASPPAGECETVRVEYTNWKPKWSWPTVTLTSSDDILPRGTGQYR